MRYDSARLAGSSSAVSLRRREDFDGDFFLLVLLLLGIGVLTVFSASFPRAYYDPAGVTGGKAWYYFVRQLLYALLGLGLLLAAMSVFFRDVQHLWGVVLTAWTYGTPLFWPASLLEGWMVTVEQFNPMYHYVTYFRDIVMWNILPSGQEHLICLGMAVITFAIGLLAFRKAESKFILYI